MSNWLVKASDMAKSTWNVISSIGPFLASQSDSLSEAYARHQMRLASVEAGKELLLQEIRTLGDVKKLLLQKYIEADATERVRLKRDVADINSSIRQINVGAKAISYIATEEQQPSEPAASPNNDTPQEDEVAPHWMDKFSELARAHNEPWREDLLARALATESTAPGTVSPRALWILGTLEEHQFVAFATVLNLCSSIGGLVIPSHLAFNSRAIPDCPFGENVGLGHIIFRLQEVGLIAETLTTSRTVRKGSRLIASYGDSKILIECLSSDLTVRGVMLTGLGASVASFCERTPTLLGKEIFDAWLATVDKSLFPQSVVA